MRRALFALSLFAALPLACSSSSSTAEHEQEIDYRSPVGKEYAITGRTEIVLQDAPADPEARLWAANIEAAREADRITKALDAYFWKIWPEEKRQSQENIVVMVRDATPDAIKVQEEAPGRYFFTYTAEVAGPNAFLTEFPLETRGEDVGLELQVGEGTEGAYSLWLAFQVSETTPDAYPDYRAMFADGLDIAIHVGGDHYDPRNDLREAEAIYDELVSLGLRAPVPFAELALDSGPFVGTLDVGGERVDVRATLVHADMAADTELDKLVDAYKAAAKRADVVIYRGHAGTSLDYSGVVVHYEPRVAIPASEFKALDLPEKYQLFVFDGCETYTGYADKLYEHPAKGPANADVITSVNYGSGLVRAESVRALLDGLLDQREGTWTPQSWDGLLRGVNDAKRGRWTPIYGVHGLADNPKLSPLAVVETIGQVCQTSANCPGVDNLCLNPPDGVSSASICGAACTDDAGCPEGTACVGLSSRTLGTTRQCAPPTFR